MIRVVENKEGEGERKDIRLVLHGSSKAKWTAGQLAGASPQLIKGSAGTFLSSTVLMGLNNESATPQTPTHNIS